MRDYSHRDYFHMDKSSRPSTLRRAASSAGHRFLWLITLSLGVVALLRIFYQDGNLLLIWLNAFTRYLYFPAYLSMIWAAWRRSWCLLGVNSMIVCFHVALLAPNFLRDQRFDPPTEILSSATDASPTLRIFFANVNGSNEQYETLLNEIAIANPDVIVLVEFTWPWHIAFKSAPVMAPYVHGTGILRSHIGSINIFSKLPLLSESQEWVAGRALHTVAVQLGAQALRIVGLHAPRPIGQCAYDKYWSYALPRLTSASGPTVIVGDFNASEHSRVYAELTADWLRSAHDDRGRGYAVTWPNGQFWLPPIRIDQAFVSPDVECVAITEGEGRGSDHKPLIVDVRIRFQTHIPLTSAYR
jgi:endonuclease/exonuclease/phosphatase (EEP) superfamily protein YafD